MKVAVLGQGYVGLSVSVGLSKAEIRTVGLDVNKRLITNLQSGISHVPDVDIESIKTQLDKGLLTFSANMSDVGHCDVIIIAVPTPITGELNPDLSYLEQACKDIRNFGKKGALIVNESTSYPGTLRKIIIPLTDPDNTRGFLYASAPERIDPNNENWKLINTPRVISGTSDIAISKTEQLYSKFCGPVSVAQSPEIAEASKIFENTFRQVNIALVNEFSRLMQGIGISANDVLEAANSKPFGFMKFLPGIGVGGHCIPVDPHYLTSEMKKLGFSTPLIDMANAINLDQPRSVANLISRLLNHNLKDIKIQLAGISYKVDTPDLRESPAIKLMQELRILGAVVNWCDPIVQEFDGEFSTPLKTDIDVGLIITPHTSFDFSIWRFSNVKVLDLSVSDKNYGWDKFL